MKKIVKNKLQLKSESIRSLKDLGEVFGGAQPNSLDEPCPTLWNMCGPLSNTACPIPRCIA